MKNSKYRIIKITRGDKTSWFEVQKRNWFGKWVNAIYGCYMGLEYPTHYKTFEEAEEAYYCNFVSSIVEVVKEYE